jgi:PAS domain S-box-containing protein
VFLRSLAIVARVAAAGLVVLGVAVLAGWAFDVWWLKDPLYGFRHMVPNTALMFAVSGVALWLAGSGSAARGRVWAARALAAGCGSLALATLLEDAVGRDFGIDRILFDTHPARPSTPTSIAVLLSSAAILGLDVRPRRGPAPSELLAAIVAGAGSLTLGAYLFGADQFYVSSRYPDAAGMALHAAIGLVVLAIGIVAARPTSGVMAIATSPLVGGQMVRKTLPIGLCVLVVGYLAAKAQNAGLFDPPGADVVATVTSAFVGGALTLVVGQSLNRADEARRRTEQEIREWQRFFDRATFGAAFGALDGKLGRINEAFARMHGCAVEELEGAPIADVFPPHRHAELAEKLALAHERGACRWESEHVRKDGSVFPVRVDLSAIRDDAGTLLYQAAIVQDITEEKKAEAVRARLCALVQSADDAIIAKTLDGVVLDWNRGAERIYGYTAEEMVGRSITTIVPEDRRAERDALHAQVRRGEIVVGFETIRVHKDGRRIPVALTLSPIRDALGRVVGVSAIQRDISRLKELEREREEWASIVAHDLRQPSAVIRFAVDMLETQEGAARHKAVQRIRRAADQLERMIQDLLDVSRIEAQRLSVRPERTALSALIAEVLEAAPHLAIRCRAEIDPAADCAWVDEARVVQVLSNLLSNADKYSDPGTPIDVRVERRGELVQVSVTNEGPGIAPDEIPKLFSRFARTRSARSGQVPGLGLGLYICRGIVESLGGRLWVESVPGDKTHFRFTLPRATEDAERLTA